MRKIVIVEDSFNDAEKLESCIRRFFDENNELCSVTHYSDGFEMLENHNCEEDIIFLDIDMPGMNGIELAKKIREVDENVSIIFVSNLAQFALKGYEVAALDYIVKPYDYSSIVHRLRRAIKVVKNKYCESISLKVGTNIRIVIETDDIIYIEKDNNYVVFHTTKDTHRVRGVFGDFDSKLHPNVFSYCIKGCLVNLAYVEKIDNDMVYVKGASLPLSRHKKKEFTNALFSYLGEKQGGK